MKTLITILSCFFSLLISLNASALTCTVWAHIGGYDPATFKVELKEPVRIPNSNPKLDFHYFSVNGGYTLMVLLSADREQVSPSLVMSLFKGTEKKIKAIDDPLKLDKLQVGGLIASDILLNPKIKIQTNIVSRKGTMGVWCD